MLHGLKVVVVVPAYDEAPRIGRVLRAVPDEVDLVIVVDDASRDGTPGAALATATEGPAGRVVIVTQPQNRGVGAAIATGYARALELVGEAPSTFVVMAGDGQMDPRDLPALVRPVGEGRADYVKGCRFDWPGARETMPRSRWLGGHAFSWLTSLAIGQRVRDSQCGYTALSSLAASRLDLEGLWPGYGYPNDLLGQLVVRGLRIVEVPVRPVYADEVSRLRLRHLPTIAGLVARAWVRRTVSGGTSP